MTTVTFPASVRQEAMAILALRLGRYPQAEDALAGAGSLVVVALLLDLETAFGIGLDVDEVLPNATVGDLLALVEQRAGGRPPPAPRAAVLYWDDERARRGLPPSSPVIPGQRSGAAAQAEPGTPTPTVIPVSAQPKTGTQAAYPPQTRGSHPYPLIPAEPDTLEARRPMFPSPTVRQLRMADRARLRRWYVRSFVELPFLTGLYCGFLAAHFGGPL